MTFTVIDTKTGQYPDTWEIACKEEWAKCLCYCDIEGFAVEEDGTLVLLDECGKVAYCPEGRFRIIPEPQWIPVTERLPEEPYGCLAIVWDNPRYDGDMFLNYYPEFVGWDGETWNDADGEEIPFDVVYWMKMPQIPEPPKEGE